VSDRDLPPTATIISFIDCINHANVSGLGLLMAEDHALQVFDEPALVGRDENIEAWSGYLSSFPKYVIHPHHIAADGLRVAVVGHTTGSHLGLPDDREAALTLIWVGEVDRGLVRSWRLLEDNPGNRASLRLDQV
jgi:hypothetical protein